jgi:hypothetical protein
MVFHSSLLGMSFILYSFYLLSVVLALAFSRLLLASSILKKNLLTLSYPPQILICSYEYRTIVIYASFFVLLGICRDFQAIVVRLKK